VHVRAAFRNSKVRFFSGKPFIGIWHATILDMKIGQRYPESSVPGEAQVPVQSLQLRIGEPGVDGYSSELEVPWTAGCVVGGATARHVLHQDALDHKCMPRASAYPGSGKAAVRCIGDMAMIWRHQFCQAATNFLATQTGAGMH
jgi:hypothetical protein